MVIEPESILKSLLGFPGTGRYWVAYSGGLDSHVLLHLMASLRNRLEEGELRAVHVNHGLLPEALEWEVHCQQVCRELEIPCEILRVKAGPAGGEGPEAAARQARYTAIGKLMARDDVILTAHHQDDQAETLLLHLVRGSGPHGLAAMPSVRRFLPGWLGRPLLGYPRAALRLYGESHLLDWIDDPSNREDRYERNFLRNEILPAMKIRRPDLIGVLSRVASHQAEAICLMDELAKIDHAAVLGPAKDRLRVSGLRLLSPERRRNVIRYWIRGLG
ncbi:MAG: tRNA lysidine(34) synthetase TilS, partial [Gammaproteobacteria bacterium]|nr:tRNA lysidine(34) synthetase TilS [Gammaproteobacteria bacterium]